MTTKVSLRRNKKGFTLIEVIITLVLASMLVAVISSFMGSTITKSANPVILVKDQSRINEVMEKIVDEYKVRIINPPLDFNAFISHVSTSYIGTDVTLNFKCISFDAVTNIENPAPLDCGLATTKILKITLNKGPLKVTNLFTR